GAKEAAGFGAALIARDVNLRLVTKWGGRGVWGVSGTKRRPKKNAAVSAVIGPGFEAQMQVGKIVADCIQMTDGRARPDKQTVFDSPVSVLVAMPPPAVEVFSVKQRPESVVLFRGSGVLGRVPFTDVT